MVIPAISVISTVKNGSDIIRETIESIRNQTFQDWEMLIVDDGSIDSTYEIIQEFSQRDGRIIGISSGGAGRVESLNLALKRARSDLIANIDADDPSHPQRLEISLKMIQDNPQFSALCSYLKLVYGFDAPIEWDMIDINNVKVKDITGQLVYRNPVGNSSVMFQKNRVLEIGGYKKDWAQGDYDLWIRMAENECRIGIITSILASHRFHDLQHFERKKRFLYALKTSEMQRKAIRSLGGGITAWLYLLMKYIKLLIPKRLVDQITIFCLNHLFNRNIKKNNNPFSKSS